MNGRVAGMSTMTAEYKKDAGQYLLPRLFELSGDHPAGA